MYDHLEIVNFFINWLSYFFNLLYSVSTVMITVTYVDLVTESITLQCNILLLYLYLISFLLLLHDEWNILIFD